VTPELVDVNPSLPTGLGLESDLVSLGMRCGGLRTVRQHTRLRTLVHQSGEYIEITVGEIAVGVIT